MTQDTLGFTASRTGVTAVQHQCLIAILHGYQEKFKQDDYSGLSVHHGDCIGGDEVCHHLVRLLVPAAYIVGHPCNLPQYRAYCACDEYREEGEPLARNRNIVDEIQFLIGLPDSMVEKVRGSGTWATIRYARQTKRARLIIFPDGTTGE